MVTLLIRTFFIYVFLMIVMRLMGKRQIGELEVTDLVTTLLLSEVASLPIVDPSIPVSHALIPMIVLLSLEVFSSYLLLRFPALKKFLSAPPTILIKRGVLDQQALLETRLSVEELMSEIRQQGYTGLGEISDAILEKDGKLTILPKPQYAPLTAEQFGISPKEECLMHIVYTSGHYNDTGLSLIGKDRKWLQHQLSKRGVALSRLFCVTANSDGKLYWIELKRGGKK